MNKPPFLQLQNLSKDYGEGDILKNLSLDIYEGEFLTLLGPSGCGKTTTLRIIAGLEEPNSGTILLSNEDITSLPPEKRPLNTVFQNYALFPHMNVFQNIAYGLRFLGVNKSNQKKRVLDVLSLVQLDGFEKRMPSQLSGGQRQRVAIARALVLEPKVLLLDEPLGALDLKLRQDMQQELKKLQKRLGITFIYITHDQEEALNMSSRIAIMKNGVVEQIGTPEDIYEHPQTYFVADFVGNSNLIQGELINQQPDGNATLKVNDLLLPVCLDKHTPSLSSKVVLCLRPQRVRYSSVPKHDTDLKGVITHKRYASGMQHTRIALSPTLEISAISQTAELDNYPVGSEVYVGWSLKHAPLLPVDGGL